jgi:hypothetical protein
MKFPIRYWKKNKAKKLRLQINRLNQASLNKFKNNRKKKVNNDNNIE